MDQITNRAITRFYGVMHPDAPWDFLKIRETCHPYTPYIAQALLQKHLSDELVDVVLALASAHTRAVRLAHHIAKTRFWDITFGMNLCTSRCDVPDTSQKRQKVTQKRQKVTHHI
eukprot:96404-Prymnesium_polylepis.2